MPENQVRKVRIPEITTYRKGLAKILFDMRSTSPAARAHLQEVRQSPAYQLARTLEIDPTQLNADHGLARVDQLHGREQQDFGFYRSNEYYAGLAPRLQNLGGVGLVVGSDQPLDFFTMANLNQVYAVDIDPDTHLVTRGYLELGTRFHQLLGRYPSTDEYLNLFDDNRDVFRGLLAAPTSGYNYSQADVDWLGNLYERGDHSVLFKNYLRQKRRFYRDASWIGSDQNLADVIEAYEQGRIKICRGSIDGDLIPTIGRRVRSDGENVSLIYTSNAPIRTDATLAAFKTLPIIDSTLVVFSDNSSSEKIHVPQGYSSAGGWNHYGSRVMILE